MRLNKIAALVLSSIVIVTSSNFVKASTSTSSTSAYRSETYRPKYHFTPDIGWMNDPNGMVYYHGVYHLFYQYNPYDTVWGPMHWGHAESKDMINWKQEPIALAPDANGDIFSGSVAVDWNNSSGLFDKTSDHTGLVAFYTTNSATTGQQYQSMAYSTDDGKTWTKYNGGKAIIAQPENTPNFRDPKVSWDNEHNKWVMVLAAGNEIQFYSSNDLKNWTKTGEFGAEGQASHAGVWECPDLYQMTVSGQNTKKWVLSINLGSSVSPDSPPAGGSGMMYIVGDFDGSKFIADPKFAVSNYVGASDIVKGYYLLPGDTIKVYDAQTGGNMLGTATVAASQSTATVNLAKDLGCSNGKVWLSITRNGQEGTRLESDYSSEVASTITGTAAVAPPGEDITNPDFETGDLTGWTATGNEWSNKNVVDNATWGGGSGRYHCSGYTDPATGGVGDPGTGTLESTVFTLGGNGSINFLVAGGDLPKLAYVTLEDATTGKELTQFNTSGLSTATVRRVNWDASSYLGKKLRIKVVDNATGGFGHIDVDDFHVYNTVPYKPPTNQLPSYPVNWVDYGPDFYAGVTWNDTTPQTNATTAKYGKYVPDGRRILLGWMSNWAYADQTPTTTWRSADSIPREEKLVATNDGYKITQQPIKELSRIQKTATKALTNTTISKGNTVSLGSESTYEITSTFNIKSTTSSEFGINVKVGGDQYTTVGYDKATSALFLNRYNSSSFDFLDYMPNKQEAPLKPDAKGNIKLQILVDKDSVEVFGGNGDNASVTITDQIFSDNSSNGIKLYSTGGSTKLNSLVVTPLKSAKFTPYINNTLPYKPKDVHNTLPTSDFESGIIPDFWKQTEGYTNTFTTSNATSWWGGTYNQDGKSFLTTFGKNGDAASGILKSNYFKLSGDGKISFLIGGGNHPTSEYLALVDGSTGTKLFSATGENSETLKPVIWDASKYVGKVVYLEIADQSQGSWGHINLDDINVPHFNSNIKKYRTIGTWGEIGPYGMQGSSTSDVSNGLYIAAQKAKNLIYEAKVSNVTSDSKTKAGEAGLVFGASKHLANAYEFNIDPSKGVARLFNKKDGKDLVPEVKETLSSDKSYKLKVVISGRNVKTYLDSTKIFDINIASYTGGNVGLDVLDGSADFQDASFQDLDNLKINLGTYLAVKQSINLAITATDGNNGSNVDTSNLDIVYSSNNPMVATVDASGKVTGVASGTAIITVESEGKTATYLIYVQ
ncbi:GH32 C-terminal domain-containing protein [Clostridium neuense]|uniref:GH32 C-terminal domain-containing protein n=1 Tax=Clostridium neuense TaxID=1728934 RepID=A0ABW8THR3_9CLOT